MRFAVHHQRTALGAICLLLISCGIPGSVWRILATQPEYRVLRVTIAGPDQIQEGASAAYTVDVEFRCEQPGVVKVIRELWDSDFPPVDPDELLAWTNDDVLCEAPPATTLDTKTLFLRCTDGDVRGAQLTDPDGRSIEPNSGEGSDCCPPPAEIVGRAQGLLGFRESSGEMQVLCIA